MPLLQMSMEIKSKTFTETTTYKCFEKGEKVRDTTTGKIYIVEKMHEPQYIQDSAIVFLENFEFGKSASYLELVD